MSNEKLMKLVGEALDREITPNDRIQDTIIELVEKVKGLELQANDMAEKHAEKDIMIDKFKTALEWVVDCSVDYQSIHKAANALYEVSNHGK